MSDLPDARLLEQFTRDNSEEAFTALVQRHIALVHSVALRHTTHPQQAQDITQAVFVILARKAGTLGRNTVLPGWLYHAARLTAANFRRNEMRRVRREQESFMQSRIEEPADDALWRELSPQLDEAMACLGTAERDALVLRYFQNKSMAEVGGFLGLAENTAQKRVSRALEKLRRFFLKRGVVSTTAAIAAMLSANSVQAVPLGLAATISTAAINSSAAAASALTLIEGALRIMAWTKAKTAIAVGAGVLLATSATVVVNHMTTASAADRAPVEMTLKWQAGRKYVMHMEKTETSEPKQPTGAKPVKQVVKMSADYSLSMVKEIDNGGWQLQLEFRRLTMEVVSGDRMTLSADSTQNPADDIGNSAGAFLPKMVGARLQYFLNANGKVERMEGYQELVNRVAGTNPPEQAAFRELFPGNTLEKFGGFAEDTTPRRVVKPGDRWTMRLKDASDTGIVNVDLKCAFKRWEQHAGRKCMRIPFAGTVATDAGADSSRFPMSIERGKMSGNVWFDPELGMVVEAVYQADLRVKLSQRGQLLTTPVNEMIRFALVELEDLASN